MTSLSVQLRETAPRHIQDRWGRWHIRLVVSHQSRERSLIACVEYVSDGLRLMVVTPTKSSRQ